MKKVLVFGTFDILHPGHIHFLKQAKARGDFLIVSIARENYIEKIKGRKPVNSETDRKKLLESLKFVNRVVLGSRDNYIGHILKQRPDVIVLGYDQKAFTKGLAHKLEAKGLKNVKIIRERPYKSKYYRSRLWK